MRKQRVNKGISIFLTAMSVILLPACSSSAPPYYSADTFASTAATAQEAASSIDSDIEVQSHNTEEYGYIKENSFLSVKANPFSTFAADVDTASYANIRRMILSGEKPPADAVRLEEMINYFSYDYPQPQGGEPFSVTTELAPCP